MITREYLRQRGLAALRAGRRPSGPPLPPRAMQKEADPGMFAGAPMAMPKAPTMPAPASPLKPPINVNPPAAAPAPAPAAAPGQGLGSMFGGMGGGMFKDNPAMLGQLYSSLGPAIPALAKYTGGLGLYALNDFLTSGGKNIAAFMPGKG